MCGRGKSSFAAAWRKGCDCGRAIAGSLEARSRVVSGLIWQDHLGIRPVDVIQTLCSEQSPQWTLAIANFRIC